jgi:hypothetical protein
MQVSRARIELQITSVIPDGSGIGLMSLDDPLGCAGAARREQYKTGAVGSDCLTRLRLRRQSP